MIRNILIVLLLAIPVRADDATDALAKELRDYATAELAKVPDKDGKYSTALPDYLNQRLKEANHHDREAWAKIKTKADWEKFRDVRISALRESLGTWPPVPKEVPGRVTKTIEAGDYAIENLLYQSRPDVWVSGNLYRPTAKRERMPVILIAHSHHAPKEQGELQDMGVTWAKLGCLVLVIDQLGHGERRQHPFATAKDFPKEFRVGRQDYYFRYNLNLQLSLVGDSLMGWMVWDLMRGLDVCLARPGADKDRVILLGAVAAGGDVTAVTAALDPRFKCVVPFNFGGPQPETRYPLPENAEECFNYAGSGSWESTRNLRDSAAGGFLPWVIVASVAPRRVIHAHEFSWDRDRDPVWKRYRKVWGFYDATDNLGFTTGTGQIQINDAKASHCTNIGPIQRKGIYAAMKKWFDIPVPEKEGQERRPASELKCWTGAAVKDLKPKPLHDVLAGMAERQLDEMRLREARASAEGRTDFLLNRLRVPFAYRNDRTDFAGNTLKTQARVTGGCEITWASFDAGPGSTFRGLVLRPVQKADKQLHPGVVCVCQDGAYQVLRDHATVVAALIQAGVGVIVPEVSGTGLQQPGGGRGRTSYATSLSSTAQMLGKPLLGTRFDDLITLWKASVQDVGVDPERVALWGESLAATNSEATSITVPYDLDQPHLAEPLGATLVSLLGLGKAEIKAVVARGGLVSYRSVLDSPFIHVPHDALPVNVFRAGDLPDVWAHLSPKPLRLEGLVDGTNRRVTGERLDKELRPVKAAYAKGGLVVKEDYSSDAELAKWIIEQMRR
jgi:dienelactone hydrolase